MGMGGEGREDRFPWANYFYVFAEDGHLLELEPLLPPC